jgi:hypothetical protein
LKIAWSTEPESLNPKFGDGSAMNDYHWVFNSSLTYYDFAGASHPMLAREIPSQENGDWVINPDGTMVTIYRLRERARWHDGAPLSAQDFALAFEVYMDREMPVRDRAAEAQMSRVEARDPYTLVGISAAVRSGSSVGPQDLRSTRGRTKTGRWARQSWRPWTFALSPTRTHWLRTSWPGKSTS